MNQLSQRIQDFIQTGSQGSRPTLPDELVRDVFQHQYEAIAAYRTFCQKRNVTPESIRSIDDIPPVPTSIFKTERIATFPPEQTKKTFLTSGTTISTSGKHEYTSLELYEDSCWHAFTRLTPPRPTPYAFLSIIPHSKASPQSSLAHMVSILAARADMPLACTFEEGAVDCNQTLEKLRSAEMERLPLLLATTAVSLWDLLKEMKEKEISITLPCGSQLFETGGRKGRRYVPTSADLATLATTHLGITQENYLAEYGMTELSSPSWGQWSGNTMIYRAPFWAPIQIVDPKTLKEVPIGKEGLIKIFDLANVESISALLTGDWGKRHRDGFEIIGRVIETDLRGCSLYVTPHPHLQPIHNGDAPRTNIRRRATQLTVETSLSLHDRVAVLGELAHTWSDPCRLERRSFEKEFLKQHPHSSGALTEGLSRTFSALTEKKLLEAIQKTFPDAPPFSTSSSAKKSLFIHAGNLPITGVFGFFASLLMGTPSLHRPSSRGGDLLERLQASLKKVNPTLAEQADVIRTSSNDSRLTQELFSLATTIFAQGDDGTLRDLHALVPSGVTWVPYRSKISAALLLDPEQAKENDFFALMEDILIWDQLGCLSPQLLWIRTTDNDVLSSVRQRLHHAADVLGRHWQRTPTPRDQGRITWWKQSAEVQPQEPTSFFQSEQLTSMQTSTIQPTYFSTPGLIQLIPFVDRHHLEEQLLPWKDQLSSVASTDLPTATDLNAFDRVVPWGELQSPSFSWHQDGHDRLSLLRG